MDKQILRARAEQLRLSFLIIDGVFIVLLSSLLVSLPTTVDLSTTISLLIGLMFSICFIVTNYISFEVFSWIDEDRKQEENLKN